VAALQPTEPHPPHRDCMCVECAPSFEDYPTGPVCTCKTNAGGVVHRTDGPCFHYDPQPDEPVKVPSDDDLLELSAGLIDTATRGEVIDFARALLARYGQPTNPKEVK
jgi:hypothetical protein